MIKNILFDVDGTLWDSAARVGECWTEVLNRFPETRGMVQTKEAIYHYMGHTMTDIAAMMMPEVPEPKRSEIMNLCIEEENRYLATHSGDFYEDIQTTFATLRSSGYRLFIVSNCQVGYIETLLKCGGFTVQKLYGDEAAGETLSQEIEHQSGSSASGTPLPSMYCIEDIECFGHTEKQKGENCRLLMARNQLLPEETVYVGDTRMDEEAAEGAGIRFLHASYGFGDATHPSAVLSRLCDLPEILTTL